MSEQSLSCTRCGREHQYSADSLEAHGLIEVVCEAPCGEIDGRGGHGARGEPGTGLGLPDMKHSLSSVTHNPRRAVEDNSAVGESARRGSLHGGAR